MSKFKFDLGDRVQDRVTKFTGIVMVQSRHMNMCNRYTVEPEQVGQDGKMLDAWAIDEQNLILIEKHVHLPIPAQAPEEEERELVASGGPRERARR